MVLFHCYKQGYREFIVFIFGTNMQVSYAVANGAPIELNALLNNYLPAGKFTYRAMFQSLSK